MHPYSSGSWLRSTVYDWMGFDEMYFIDDFPKEYYIRKYISDEEMFDMIISCYEENEQTSTDPMFLFGVTMQNHGSYTYTGSRNYYQSISLLGYEQDYDDAEQYLSVIHQTDRAVKNLITYFEGVDDDVVIVFFGDHLPKLNTDFYEELHGGEFETLEEQMSMYTIPFFIWTNYDIEEQSGVETSINYLSTYLYETAGLEMPGYVSFLEDTRETIPAMNALGYYSESSEGYLEYSEAEGDEAQAISDYAILQYNNLFDKKNKDAMFDCYEEETIETEDDE